MKIWPDDNKKSLMILSVVFLILLVITAIGCISYYYYFNNKSQTVTTNKDALATVAGKVITQSDLNIAVSMTAIGNATQATSKSSKHELLDGLVEDAIYENAASRLNISIAQADTEAQAKTNVPNYQDLPKNMRDYVLAQARYQLLKPQVDTKVVTTYEGAYVVIPYNKYFPDLLAGTADQTKQLKASEQPIATGLFDQIKTNKITFDEALKQINSNTTIDLASYPGGPGDEGGAFSTLGGIGQNPDFIKNVSNMKTGDIKLFSVALMSTNTKGDSAWQDGAYIIARLDKNHQGEAISPEAWLIKQKSALKVEVHYEKIN